MFRRSGRSFFLRGAWTLATVLALCAMFVRAVVPAGFMPDPVAASQGKIELTFCSPSGSALTQLLDLSDGEHDAPSSAAQDCPFGLIAAVAALPALASLVLLLPAASLPLAHSVRESSLPVQPATGPPLGSRAPPSVLL